MSPPPQRTPTMRGRFAAVVSRWRDLRLPVKLAVVMVVPMIVMTTLGVVLISGELSGAGQYARASRITELSSGVRAAITALQDERAQIAGATTVTRATTDEAITAIRASVAADTASGDLDTVALGAWTAANRQLGELSFLRAETATPSPDRSAMVSAYTQLVDALFAFDRVLTTGVADADLARQALALYDLFAAREEVRFEQSVVLAGIGHRTMSVDDVTALHGSEARLSSRISDFRAVASPTVLTDYAQAVSGPALASQNDLLGQAIDESGGMSGQIMRDMMITVPVPTWNAANAAVTAGLTSVTDRIAGTLSADADRLRSDASGAAGTAIAVLLVALAVTIALAVLVARQLTHSIGLLRRTARDVAARQLPDAVERIRAGETVDVGVAPVGVHTSDEIGQLARAFDAVHGEALRLAVEQANLRANYSELFVNLSRRSQSLVQRQLRLIEQLERDEEDPEQLSALFKLDHLATRMRRNNENLMVLSGGASSRQPAQGDLARGPAQPIPMADLLRAGVSEIEQYQRVVVQPPPDAVVVGYAASDIVRLLAELLDNATGFSAPDTPVTVASHRTRRRAIVIDIVDHGIGMGDEDLLRANELLGQPAGVEGRVSRRMGLFVVSRLANQHGIRVRLHGGQDIPGLRVTITVPAELIIGEPEAPIPPTATIPPGPGGPLPKRVARANGAPVAVASPPVESPTEVTVTIPAATSSGVGLFAPIPGEDAASDVAADGGEAAGVPADATPIYDTMVSAWFADADAESWRSAADTGWRAVDAVVDVEPVDFTPAGLPRRQPKARLLPGSVREHESAGERPRPTAEHVRERLAGYQQGVQRGRHAAETEPAAAPEPVAGEPLGLRPPDAPPVAVTQIAVLDWSAQSSPTAASTWTSSADAGWQAADVVADAVADTMIHTTIVDAVNGTTQVEVTPAGLPRRRPKAHLLPGSVAASNGSVAHHPAPDAGALRDRLNSFQRGVRAGRDERQPAASTPVEHGFHW